MNIDETNIDEALYEWKQVADIKPGDTFPTGKGVSRIISVGINTDQEGEVVLTVIDPYGSYRAVGYGPSLKFLLFKRDSGDK